METIDSKPTSHQDLILRYGNLIYDVCSQTLEDSTLTRKAVSAIFKVLLKTPERQRFTSHEQAWMLNVLVTQLQRIERHRSRSHSPLHWVDPSDDVALKARYAFSRLPLDDRILVTLSEKYLLPIDDIASALQCSTDSLQLRREQALRRMTADVEPHPFKAKQWIASQPRQLLPEPAAEQAHEKKWELRLHKGGPLQQLAQWRRTPWYVRTGIEGFAVLVMILVTIFGVPKLRTLYERSLDRRLEAYNVKELSPDLNHFPEQKKVTEEADSDSDADTQPGEAAPQAEILSKGPIKVLEGEIWRFYIKTESPHDLRPKIAKTLQDLQLSSSPTELRGLEAPGGIQFDLLLQKDQVITVKQQMDNFAQNILKEMGNESLSLNQIFTWYRSRSKKTIPVGKTRVIIWLSQI